MVFKTRLFSFSDIFKSRKKTFELGRKDYDDMNPTLISDKQNYLTSSGNWASRLDKRFSGVERLNKRAENLGKIAGMGTNLVVGGGLGYLAGKTGSKFASKDNFTKEYLKSKPKATEEEINEAFKKYVKTLAYLGIPIGVAAAEIFDISKPVRDRVYRNATKLDDINILNQG